jgi:hypothetical protein
LIEGLSAGTNAAKSMVRGGQDEYWEEKDDFMHRAFANRHDQHNSFSELANQMHAN